MQPIITKEQKDIYSLLQNLTIQNGLPNTEIQRGKEQDIVEEIMQITQVMVDDINKLLSFLKKGRNSEEIKYFPIKYEQKSEEWHEQRKIRLTGSNFKGYIHSLLPTRLKAPFDTFHKEAKQIYSIAIDYGVKYEQTARDEYTKLYPHYKVKEATLTIRTSQPWLGSSPDGLVYDQHDNLIGGIQIKCPYSKKDLTVEEAIKIPDFYLKQNTQKQVVLVQKHAYYYQVQGQMMILDLPWVDFVVRTEKNMKVVRILRNDSFIDYLRKQLQRYYFENYIWQVLKLYAKSDYLKEKTKYWMSKENSTELLKKLSKI